MSEISTIENFMRRDKTKHQIEVTAHIANDRRTVREFATKHPIEHYKPLWDKQYRIKNDYFDGYGWFSNLEGDFNSREEADDAFERLKSAIQDSDTLERLD